MPVTESHQSSQNGLSQSSATPRVDDDVCASIEREVTASQDPPPLLLNSSSPAAPSTPRGAQVFSKPNSGWYQPSPSWPPQFPIPSCTPVYPWVPATQTTKTTSFLPPMANHTGLKRTLLRNDKEKLALVQTGFQYQSLYKTNKEEWTREVINELQKRLKKPKAFTNVAQRLRTLTKQRKTQIKLEKTWAAKTETDLTQALDIWIQFEEKVARDRNEAAARLQTEKDYASQTRSMQAAMMDRLGIRGDSVPSSDEEDVTEDDQEERGKVDDAAVDPNGRDKEEILEFSAPQRTTRIRPNEAGETSGSERGRGTRRNERGRGRRRDGSTTSGSLSVSRRKKRKSKASDTESESESESAQQEGELFRTALAYMKADSEATRRSIEVSLSTETAKLLELRQELERRAQSTERSGAATRGTDETHGGHINALGKQIVKGRELTYLK